MKTAKKCTAKKCWKFISVPACRSKSTTNLRWDGNLISGLALGALQRLPPHSALSTVRRLKSRRHIRGGTSAASAFGSTLLRSRFDNCPWT